MGERRVWILDTDTKGTGARMVPLDEARAKEPAPEPLFVPRKRRRRPPAPAESQPPPRPPRRFRVIDVATRQVLLEDGDARALLERLGETRSSVDVNVYVLEPERSPEWRLLTLAEQREAWRRRR